MCDIGDEFLNMNADQFFEFETFDDDFLLNDSVSMVGGEDDFGYLSPAPNDPPPEPIVLMASTPPPAPADPQPKPARQKRRRVVRLELPQSSTIQSASNDQDSSSHQGEFALSNSFLGQDIDSKSVYELLKVIVQSELTLPELLNISVVLIGVVDINNSIVRQERRNKEKLKMRLEKSRAKIAPIISNPSYQMQLKTTIWNNRANANKKKANS